VHGTALHLSRLPKLRAMICFTPPRSEHNGGKWAGLLGRAAVVGGARAQRQRGQGSPLLPCSNLLLPLCDPRVGYFALLAIISSRRPRSTRRTRNGASNSTSPPRGLMMCSGSGYIFHSTHAGTSTVLAHVTIWLARRTRSNAFQCFLKCMLNVFCARSLSSFCSSHSAHVRVGGHVFEGHWYWRVEYDDSAQRCQVTR
jgi:hypothetical protein